MGPVTTVKPNYFILIQMEGDTYRTQYNLRATKRADAIKLIKDSLDLSKEARDQLKDNLICQFWENGKFITSELIEVYEIPS